MADCCRLLLLGSPLDNRDRPSTVECPASANAVLLSPHTPAPRLHRRYPRWAPQPSAQTWAVLLIISVPPHVADASHSIACAKPDDAYIAPHTCHSRDCNVVSRHSAAPWRSRHPHTGVTTFRVSVLRTALQSHRLPRAYCSAVMLSAGQFLLLARPSGPSPK